MRNKLIEFVLSKYWVPKGTPLWQHNTQAILEFTIILVILVMLNIIDTVVMMMSFAAVVPLQFSLTHLARRRW